jgi:hypothetical protein
MELLIMLVIRLFLTWIILGLRIILGIVAPEILCISTKRA